MEMALAVISSYSSLHACQTLVNNFYHLVLWSGMYSLFFEAVISFFFVNAASNELSSPNRMSLVSLFL
jgi:hypothetical protein